MRTKFLLFLIVAVLVALAAGYFFYKDAILSSFSRIPTIDSAYIEKLVTDSLLGHITKDVSTPPPLRASDGETGGRLTRAGVVLFTNKARAENGALTALKEYPSLDALAELRAKDMLEKQYFAHTSPTGVGAAELAPSVHYDFIAIGENIAAGNFKDDEALVLAWMNSPGHRANIVSRRYGDIGVAVMKGTLEGRRSWVAVQIFGLPLSVCPAPEAALKNSIENVVSRIDNAKKSASQIRDEMQRLGSGDNSYREKVDAYNALVREISSLIGQVKDLATKYNSQVKQFNACLEAIGK